MKKRAKKRVQIQQLGTAPTSTQTLLQMTDEEFHATYAAAKAIKKLHQPTPLLDAWKRWRYPGTLPEFVGTLRALIKDSELDDSSQLPKNLALFMEFMVVRFERLVDNGLFDSVLPQLTALPILYSPSAGKGAGEWERARALYKEKKIGTEALFEYRGRDPNVPRSPVWGELAEIAARVVWIAGEELPRLSSLKERAVAFHKDEWKRKGARKAVRWTSYLLNDRGFLIWPDWLELCEGLPARVRDDVARYTQAVGAVVDEFFAAPDHPLIEYLLAPMVLQGHYSRPDAVKEARRLILDWIPRFAG